MNKNLSAGRDCRRCHCNTMSDAVLCDNCCLIAAFYEARQWEEQDGQTE